MEDLVPKHAAKEVTESDQPVTFRDVFAIREYRAVYFSLVVNLVGDYLSRAAITVLVYQQSSSVLLSAAAFAISFLPWVVGGPVLSALADRFPYRSVLISSDLVRMCLIALLLIPHLPVEVMLVVIFVSSLGAPPTQAARSALLPLLVDAHRLPTALAMNATTGQAAQVVGYLAGASLAAAINPQAALGIDAITFGLSALLVLFGIRHRPATRTSKERHLLRESGEGFRLVFGTETLRAIALMAFVATMFVVVPEALAAAWAAEDSGSSASRGLNQGLIMAAGPIGFVVGGILVSRLFGTAQRERLIRPLAVLCPLALVPAFAGPPAPTVAILVALAGMAVGGLIPTLNGKFVLILPHGYRARAFGVMQSGVQLSQFGAVVVTGVLADHFRLPLVVGLWSVAGVIVMVTLVLRWPLPSAFAEAADQAAAVVSAPTARHALVTSRVTPERS
ncbi:MFS transporter [Actinoplanes sp. TBRC 11911]|nr:MFS transporter [Actinoplanes sp. TBRC 11911]